MPSVDNRGVRVAYRVQGSGEPLVLIHGWSGEGRYWDELGYVQTLSTSFRVVLPDLRGHGESGFDEMRRFAAGHRRSEFIPLEGLDHLAAWQRADVVLPPVLEFLKAVRE